MEKRAVQAAFAAIGAVVGAGSASGREIDSFFSRYGPWSWAGVAAAAGTALALSLGVMRSPGIGGMPACWRGRIWGRLWQGMFGALMLVTGGAMLSGGGEIAALMLPVDFAYELGLMLTAALGATLAGKGLAGSAAVSRALVAALLAMTLGGYLLPCQQAAAPVTEEPLRALLQGACYAGFNMALAVPGLALAAESLSWQGRKQCSLLTAALLGLMLCGGNGLLLRHPALRGAALPFVQLTARWGRAGYLLSGACMYLAILTTLAASLRGLWQLLPEKGLSRYAALAGIVLCAGLGFGGLVEKIYPLLGAGCLLLMAAACFVKMKKNA